jgi:NTP pyrophosphatase (non-canonical NTP hydrolase)
MMKLQEIQERNYLATCKRGLITDKTTLNEFIYKMFEEVQEFKDASNFGITDGLELADIIIVCLNTAKHLNIDIQDWLERKTIINENRI